MGTSFIYMQYITSVVPGVASLPLGGLIFPGFMIVPVHVLLGVIIYS